MGTATACAYDPVGSEIAFPFTSTSEPRMTPWPKVSV